MQVVRGLLTSEGIECQALRSETNELYTLVGDLGRFKIGDRVIVVGTPVTSFCQQGTTLAVTSIAAWEGNPASSPLTASEPGERVASRDLGRASYRCVRIGRSIVLHALGTLPNFNDKAALEMMPWRIWPPAFGLFVYKHQIVMPTLRAFEIAEVFAYPKTSNSVSVHDADGRHEVEIRELPAQHSFVALEGRSTETETVGYSAVSLQAAFDAAVAQLHSSHPSAADGLVVYTLKESGMNRGGFIGVDLYFARVALSLSP